MTVPLQEARNSLLERAIAYVRSRLHGAGAQTAESLLRDYWERVPAEDLVGRDPVDLAGAALAAFVMTPSLADYYIIQEPTTKRCRIVEERPASPGVGIVIGGAGFGVRTEAESRMRTVEECREVGTTGGTTVIEERERRPTR